MPTTPELLLPAGDFEKLRYAYAYGADATYLGIPRYSLRARENDFRIDSTVEAVKYAHSLNKQIYVTANVIPHNRKIDPFIGFVGDFLAHCQPDAWIVSDPGIIMLMKEHFPEQVLHLSVQANTVNYASAKFWHQIGVKRIILSREISLMEMKRIKDECPELELEAFVHGSICIAYSGRCLISNYMSNRDPNQGTCSNSCRWEYKMYQKEPVQPQEWHEGANESGLTVTQHGDTYTPLSGDFYVEESERPGQFMQLDEDENGTYLMNARDLCAIEYLQELRDAGIESFKVEGRSKSAYYAAMIARAYRQAIDTMQRGQEFDPECLRDIFATANKGFIAGFLKGSPGRTAQKYDALQAEAQAYQVSGMVRGYDETQNCILVEPRNPLRTGSSYELCTPGNTTTFTIEAIEKENGTLVPEAHGGLYQVKIPMAQNPGEFAIIREKLDDFVPEQVVRSNKIVGE